VFADLFPQASISNLQPFNHIEAYNLPISKIATEDRICYLVKRRNFQEQADFGREQVLACYANLDNANQHAKNETKRMYQDALADGAAVTPPKEDDKGFAYSAYVEVNDEWVSIHSVRIYVDSIECRSSYREDVSSSSGLQYDEDELTNTDVQPDPDVDGIDELTEPEVEIERTLSSPESYPFPLPRGHPGCLKGFKFCLVGEQEPYSESAIKAVIEQFGGTLIDFNKVNNGNGSPGPIVTTILGRMAEGDLVLERVRGKSWIDPVIDRKKLFLMVSPLGKNRGKFSGMKDMGLAMKRKRASLG
jgi:hypothetical protein